MNDSLAVTHFFSKFMRAVSRINLWLAWFSAFVLLLSTSLVFAEIMSRLMFGKSLVWVIEISEYSLLYMTFLGAPYLLEKNRHVAIDLVVEALPISVRRLVVALLCFVAAIACGYCAWIGVLVTVDQWEFGLRETTLMRPPSYLITMVFPVGMALLSVQFFAQVFDSLKR